MVGWLGWVGFVCLFVCLFGLVVWLVVWFGWLVCWLSDIVIVIVACTESGRLTCLQVRT